MGGNGVVGYQQEGVPLRLRTLLSVGAGDIKYEKDVNIRCVEATMQ